MKRPFAVTIVGWLFIVVGFASLVYHFMEGPRDRWTALIAIVAIIAIVGGVFLLRGHNWARWLILAWLAFHVGVSALQSLSQCLAHLVLFIAIGYSLLWPPGSKYFQSASSA
jgi:uncharacterized membrane protein